MNKISQYKQFILLAPFVLILLMQFNNCSKYQPPELESSSTAPSSSGSSGTSGTAGLVKTGDLCEDTLKELFAETYYPFVRNNCAGCHASGPNPQFASADVNWAYTVFQERTYTKISNNATSPTHQPPTTGTHHTQAINELKIIWQQGVGEYNTCKGLPADTVVTDPRDLLTLQTANKTVPTLRVDQEAVLTWNLTNELMPLQAGVVTPNLGATAQFSIRVTRRQNAAGQDYYTFRDPIIYNNATDIHVKTMYIKINTRWATYPSTFKYIDKSLYMNSTQTGQNIGLISTGGLVALGAVSSQDVINIGFEKLEPVNLGPRPAPVTVAFTSTAVRMVSASSPASRLLNIEVGANTPPDAPITVQVDAVTDALCNAVGDNAFTLSSTCVPSVYNYMVSQGLNTTEHLQFKQARSVVGTDYNRFDWDYKFVVRSFNLTQAEPRKNIELRFSSDIRRENNRVLRLRVSVLSNNSLVGTTDVYVVILKMNNPVLLTGEVSFSSLMREGSGVLALNCVKCHNSRDLNGGYDMTDFDLMLTKRVLIQDPFDPNNAESSKMFSRMNPLYPGNQTLTPMPLDGYLDDRLIDRVRMWIRAGAKNN